MGFEFTIKQQIKFSVIDYFIKIAAMSKSKKDFREFSIEFNIIPDTTSMKSVLTTSNLILFNSELKLLGFTLTDYPSGTHTSEKPVMISIIDKVHLKCDCVDGSIVNGLQEQILFSFNLSAPPGYKIKKEPPLFCMKK